MGRAPAAVFAAVLALGLLRAAPSLRWPMVYDDLHLVRVYTPAEIASSWRGNWDPDGIETAGFRPLSLLFNHARAALLGEHVAAHRALLVVLFASFVALMVPLAGRFGATPGAVLLAGALLLASRYQVYGYVWITDGNHMLQGIAFAGGALLLLAGLDRGDVPRLVGSLGCLAAGLLVREDTLAVAPVALLLGAVHLRRRGRAVAGPFFIYAGALAVLCAALLAYRAMVVPGAASPGIDVRSFVVAVARVLGPAGVDAPDAVTLACVVAGWLAAAALAAGLVVRRREVDWRGPVLWLAAAVIACAPALTFRRDDLLFFAGTFVALAYATGAAALARLGGSARTSAVAAMAVMIAASGWIGLVFAENFHPDSARALAWNMQMLQGDFADRATVPPERRAAALARLEAHGIRAGAQPRQRVRDLAAEARAAGRRRPAADGAVFLPLLPEGF